MQLKNMLRKSSHSAIILDQGLARLGDSLVNFLYSIAKTKALQSPTGGRVSNSVLLNALRYAGLSLDSFVYTGLKDKADLVEALIAYAWLNNLVSISEAEDILASYLRRLQFNSLQLEKDLVAQGFASVLKLIMSRLEQGHG